IIQMNISLEFAHYQHAYAAKSVQEMVEIQIRNILSFEYREEYQFENPLHLMTCTD
ncbi:hypothetical protein Bpfe_026354, partial [Biomphalaria pfeifferi]